MQRHNFQSILVTLCEICNMSSHATYECTHFQGMDNSNIDNVKVFSAQQQNGFPPSHQYQVVEFSTNKHHTH